MPEKLKDILFPLEKVQLFGSVLKEVYTEFKAEWTIHGKAAGPIRNRKMAEYGDALLLIWDGTSKGSSNMKIEMEKRNKPIYEIIIKGA